LGGLAWSVSIRPTNAEEIPRVPVAEQKTEGTRLQPDTGLAWRAAAAML
jgi:hypothetical protein